ncbi:hypothetical protein BDR06DRAFT_950387 [Suillus hirtellus]|nr:hypothetical protein BDR06DRAFT_950387 [Suillus hirtellus]
MWFAISSGLPSAKFLASHRTSITPEVVKFGKLHYTEEVHIESQAEVKRKLEEARAVREQQIWQERYNEGYAKGYAEGQAEVDQLRVEGDRLRAEVDQLRAKAFVAELDGRPGL